MVNVTELKVEEIKKLLRDRNLPSTGNKAELVQRFVEAHGSVEVEMDTEPVEPNMQDQINDLRVMMQQIMVTLGQNVNHDTEQVTNTIEENVNNNNENANANRNAYTVKEIAETIPEFNPTDDRSLSAEQFVDRVDTAIAAYNWEEKGLMLAIYSKLKGSAKLWLDGSVEMYSNWAELSEKLIEEFGSHLDEAEIHRKLSNTHREKNENVIDYCFRISALGRKYKLSDQAIIKYTRDGLKNRDLQSATAAIRFASLRDMRETFAEFLRNMPTKGAEAQTYVSNTTKTDAVNLKSEPVGTEKKVNKCFNCFEEGHFASKCPKPQRRARCVDCQKVHRLNEPQNCGKSITNVRMVETHDNLFTRVIRVNGLELSAFIDTGVNAT